MRARLPCVLEPSLGVSRRGLSSQLAEDLGGAPVLVRTLERLRLARTLDPLVLAVHRSEEAALRALVAGLPVQFFVHELSPPPWMGRLRRSRQWGKEGWRGGLLDSAFVSECAHPQVLAALFERHRWPAALLVPADAPFLDPELVDDLVATFLGHSEARVLYLSTAPPGLAGDVISRAGAELVAAGAAPVDALVRFQPDLPGGDPERWVHHFPEEVSGHRGRYTVDSGSALACARSLWQRLASHACGDAPPASSRHLLAALAEDPDLAAGPVPEEVVLELGGDEGGVFPARAARVGALLTEDCFAAVLAGCRQRDDALLTLGGGYHDPVLDPALPARVIEARAAGVFGIHVETPGAQLTPPRVAALLAARPDVITVDLTAPDAATQAALAPCAPAHEARVAGLEALIAARAGDDPPFLVVTTVFEERTASAFDAYFDRWHRRVDRVLVRGADGLDGSLPPSSMGCFAPPLRTPCVRLATQLRVEADGSVPLCDRDPAGSYPLGRLTDAGLAAIWQGAALRQARRWHAQRAWDRLPHCAPCTSWFRFD